MILEVEGHFVLLGVALVLVALVLVAFVVAFVEVFETSSQKELEVVSVLVAAMWWAVCHPYLESWELVLDMLHAWRQSATEGWVLLHPVDGPVDAVDMVATEP